MLHSTGPCGSPLPENHLHDGSAEQESEKRVHLGDGQVLLPPLSVSDPVHLSPTLQARSAAWAKRCEVIAGGIGQVTSALRTCNDTRRAHADALQNLAETVSSVGPLLGAPGRDCLAIIAMTLRQLAALQADLAAQTDLFAGQGGPLHSLIDEYNAVAFLKGEADSAHERLEGAMVKFGASPIDAGGPGEEYARRGARALDCRKKLQLLSVQSAAKLRHGAQVAKLSFTQRCLDHLDALTTNLTRCSDVARDLTSSARAAAARAQLCRTRADYELCEEEGRLTLAQAVAAIGTQYDEDMRALASDARLPVEVLLAGSGAPVSPRTARASKVDASLPTSPSAHASNVALDAARSDKSGYLFRRAKAKTWLYEYFAVRDNCLIQIAPDGSETEMARLQLSAVRTSVSAIERCNCFEVLMPSGTVCLQALSARDTDEWVAALQAGIAAALDLGTDLASSGSFRAHSVTGVRETLARIEGNDWCADCGELSKLFYFFECLDCSRLQSNEHQVFLSFFSFLKTDSRHRCGWAFRVGQHKSRHSPLHRVLGCPSRPGSTHQQGAVAHAGSMD
eukprot:m.145217 g.145217  ORF g.145217 m.145217 type:complete len:566 (+) comp15022_c0_seq6:202-1899(+)